MADRLFGFTHAELVARAEKWLRNSLHCNVVLREFVCSASEVPDVIAWQRGTSILVECKTSRSDFNNEVKKPHRRDTKYHNGMGSKRYYFVPAGLIDASEVPEKWGLLFCYGKQVKVIKEAIPHPVEVFRVAEYPLLLSIARRVELRGLMEYVRDASIVGIGDATAPSTPRIAVNPEPPRLAKTLNKRSSKV